MRRSGDSDAIIAASAPTAAAPVVTVTRATSATVCARASRAVTACSRASRSAAPAGVLRSATAPLPWAPVDGYAAGTGWVGRPLIGQFHHRWAYLARWQWARRDRARTADDPRAFP